MSENGSVRYQRDGVVATVTFDRPARRNALTWAMFDAFDETVARMHDDAGLRVAIVRGTDGHFVAGTDIAQFAAFETAHDGLAYERRLESTIARLEAVPFPTIAAVEGAAVGAGLLIASACDLRVCTPDAYFGAPIARTVGNCLSIASLARLVAHLGPARTLGLILTADRLDADEARDAGFVNEIVSPDGLDEKLRSLCERIAAQAPITLRVTKEAVRRLRTAGITDSDALIREAYGSRDFREGVAAFLEKRDPRWTGE